MFDPNFEIQKLRFYLQSKDISYADIDRVCDAAATDLNEVVLSVVSEAMVDAVNYAESIGADEFIEDIDIIESGGVFAITTRSGKTNYSKPEVKNLQNLLKNGKVSKDGSRYRVIPLSDSDNRQKIGKSIFEDQAILQSKIQAARDALTESMGRGSNKDTKGMVKAFRNMISSNMQSRKSFYTLSAPTGKPKFRTASDKQDPNTSWVIPAKNIDMTSYLMTINSKIIDDVRSISLKVISEYERLF